MRPKAFCQADPQKVDLKRQCMDVMPHAGQRKMLAGHRHDGGRLCVSARLEVVRPQNRVLKKARPFTFFFTPRLTQPLSSRHHRVHDLRSLRRNAHSPTPAARSMWCNRVGGARRPCFANRWTLQQGSRSLNLQPRPKQARVPPTGPLQNTSNRHTMPRPG